MRSTYSASPPCRFSDGRSVPSSPGCAGQVRSHAVASAESVSTRRRLSCRASCARRQVPTEGLLASGPQSVATRQAAPPSSANGSRLASSRSGRSVSWESSAYSPLTPAACGQGGRQGEWRNAAPTSVGFPASRFSARPADRRPRVWSSRGRSSGHFAIRYETGAHILPRITSGKQLLVAAQRLTDGH